MIWDLFKRKKDKKDRKLQEEAVSMEPLAKQSLEGIVVDKCEQILALSSEITEDQNEYRMVTNYLNDIQIVEELSETDHQALVETAYNLVSLNANVDDYLKAEKKISEVQFRQMQEQEEEIPGAIKRLKDNEIYLEKIKRDMNYLEGEKTEWIYLKEDAKEHMQLMKRVSFFALLIVGSLILLLILLNALASINTQIYLIIALLLVALYAVYFFVKLQDDEKTLKKANACINRAISLENHVKIKYVNIKNAVNYTTERYHVNNSRELEYVWDCYNEAVREHAKYRQNSADLEYFQEKLIRQLKRYRLYDTSIWLKYTKALVDKREMVEVKHDLLTRRQRLRDQIEYKTKAIGVLKTEVEKDLPRLSAGKEKVEEILKYFE